MELREKLIAEFETANKAIASTEKKRLTVSVSNFNRPGDPISGIGQIIYELLDNVYRLGHEKASSAHSMTPGLFATTVGALYNIALPEGDIDTVFSPENNYDIMFRGFRVEGDTVFVTVHQWVRFKPEATEKPKQKWVQIDDSTRKLQPIIGDDGKPVMERKTGEPCNELVDMTYAFPLSFFVDVCVETGRGSLLEPVPEGYVPEPLGTNMSRLFDHLAGPMMMAIPPWVRHDMGLYDGGPDDGRKRRRPPGMPPFPMFRSGRMEPFRVFLKPEPGTDRLEVQIEPFPKEQIDAHEAIREQRKRWAQWRITDTAAFKAFAADVQERIKPAETA